MGLWENIKNIMTIPEEDDYEEELEQEEQPAPRRTEEQPTRRETPRLIKSKSNNQTTNGAMQVVLVKPERFDDVRDIADHLNAGKTAVLNLEVANRGDSRRIVDFLSGVAYANHGNMRKVAANTFIIVANNVDVMGELSLDEFDENKLYF